MGLAPEINLMIDDDDVCDNGISILYIIGYYMLLPRLTVMHNWERIGHVFIVYRGRLRWSLKSTMI